MVSLVNYQGLKVRLRKFDSGILLLIMNNADDPLIIIIRDIPTPCFLIPVIVKRDT